MGTLTRKFGLGVILLAALAAFGSRGASAQAVGGYGSVKLQWHNIPVVNLTITPNYQSGFGPQGGVGSGSTPAPGGGASLNGGVVDFGNQVVQGYSYLYKYAVKAAVETNDAGGFTLYAEGTTDIQDNTNPGSTIPLNQTLYWLNSNAGKYAIFKRDSISKNDLRLMRRDVHQLRRYDAADYLGCLELRHVDDGTAR